MSASQTSGGHEEVAERSTTMVQAVATMRAETRGSLTWGEDFDRVLEPTRGLQSFRIGELREFRELLYFLTWRDVKVRYKQTALGVVWAVLQPVLGMLLFTFIFAHVAKIGSGGIPYPIFSYSALLPWLFFANAVTLASQALTVNPQLITKVYFPRIFLVMAPILAGIVDFVLAFTVLIGLMVYYSVGPDSVGTPLLVPLLLIAFLTTVGASAGLAALNVKYRDVRFVVPFLVQVWFFATPVVYPIRHLAQPWKSVYDLNPMVAVAEGFRWALAGGPRLSGQTFGISAASALAVFALGIYYFHRTEKSFADVI
jgi:lipopolysaccharide transport system permease protein